MDRYQTLEVKELVDQLSERELVLLYDLVRIDNEFERCGRMETVAERELHELLLDQLRLLMARLSPEDTLIWQCVEQVVDRLRVESLERSTAEDYSLDAIVRRAEEAKGGPLSKEEYDHLAELAEELAEVDRKLFGEE
jgi:hypothetical protein